MDVNSICGYRDVQIRAVPEGTSMPETAAPTAQDIETLGELEWVLQEVAQFETLRASIMARLGQAGQPGGITDHAWQIWAQVSQRLSTRSGTRAEALPLEILIGEIVSVLQAEANVQNDGDLVILSGILDEYEPFLNGVTDTLTDGNHSIAAGESYAEDRSFKYNIRRIVNRIYSNLSEQLRTELGYNDQTFWADSFPAADSIQALLTAVQTQTTQACNEYNDMVPEPPAPPVINPPVTPAQPEPQLLGYGIDLTPSYAIQMAGDQTAPIQSGPGLFGQVALSLNFDDFSLQATYRAGLGLNSFEPWTSDLSRDYGIFDFTMDDLTVQGTYIWQRDYNNVSSIHLGALGAGYRLLDGLLEPFGHIILGGGDGFVIGGSVGARTSYSFENLPLTLRAEVLYNILNQEQLSHRVGGSAGLVWSPVSFGGADLEIGAQVSGLYNVDPQGANIVPGLVLGWNTADLAQPYTVDLY